MKKRNPEITFIFGEVQQWCCSALVRATEVEPLLKPSAAGEPERQCWGWYDRMHALICSFWCITLKYDS